MRRDIDIVYHCIYNLIMVQYCAHLALSAPNIVCITNAVVGGGCGGRA